MAAEMAVATQAIPIAPEAYLGYGGRFFKLWREGIDKGWANTVWLCPQKPISHRNCVHQAHNVC